jgi:hypothetical protein
MNFVVHIPDDIAERLSAGGDVERQALEALAAEAYHSGRLTKPEISRLLGFKFVDEFDGFLKTHGVPEPSAVAEVERKQQHLSELWPDEARRCAARAAAANIIARRKGVTLGGLTIKELVNEGRP